MDKIAWWGAFFTFFLIGVWKWWLGGLLIGLQFAIGFGILENRRLKLKQLNKNE